MTRSPKHSQNVLFDDNSLFIRLLFYVWWWFSLHGSGRLGSYCAQIQWVLYDNRLGRLVGSGWNPRNRTLTWELLHIRTYTATRGLMISLNGQQTSGAWTIVRRLAPLLTPARLTWGAWGTGCPIIPHRFTQELLWKVRKIIASTRCDRILSITGTYSHC